MEMMPREINFEALQRTGAYRGRPVLAMDVVLAGEEWALCLAAELGR